MGRRKENDMNEANNIRQPISVETECAKGHSDQRLVSRRRTGYKDKNGKSIREGDTLEGYFSAPWDEEVWITRRFRVVKDPSGRWLCDGIEANDENDWLANFKRLEVVKPANAADHRQPPTETLKAPKP